MAGDWIKIEHVTPDKPEIHQIADFLGIDSDAVVGKILRFWIWADQQAVTGNAVPVTKTLIDRITYAPGFADALLKVGWLLECSGSYAIPHFDRHNGQTAKTRADTNRRVARHRANCNANSVTDPLPKPLPEKRREESTDRERNNGCAGIRRPNLAEAKSVAAGIGVTPEKADDWWHTREASAWMKGTAGGGTTPVGTNWQADLKIYASRIGFDPPKSTDHRRTKAAHEYPEPPITTLPRA